MIYVASCLPVFVFQVYARPEIKSMADLKGKVVAVTQPAASTDYAMRIVLKRNGLEPDKDVKILYSQDILGVLNNVSAGNAAAGIMSAPTSLKAKAAGYQAHPQHYRAQDSLPFYWCPVFAQSHPRKERGADSVSACLHRSDGGYPDG